MVSSERCARRAASRTVISCAAPITQRYYSYYNYYNTIEGACGSAIPCRDDRSARVLQAGGYAVDGQQQQPFQALTLRIPVAQRGERPQLQVRERVHVRATERDGPAQHGPGGEQPVLPGDRQHEPAGQVLPAQNE